MERFIHFPWYVFRGIRPGTRMYKEREVFGADSETYKGAPYTIQIFGRNVVRIQRVSKRNILDYFLGWIMGLPANSAVYVHNLSFDLPVFLFPLLRYLQSYSRFELDVDGVNLRILYGKVCHMDVSYKGRSWEIVDSFAFFKASIHNTAKKLGIEKGKLKKPRGLGNRKFIGKDWPSFAEYAMRDAELAYLIGLKIEAFHKDYDVVQTISAPQLAAKVFKRHYVKSEIPCPPYDVCRASILSYHGGKSGLYVEPGIYRKVYLYDINSAYPYAFTKLPNFQGATYHYGKYKPKEVGIWNVSGVSATDKYNLLRDHTFKPLVGLFEKIWVTSYELQCALKHGWLPEFTIHEGYWIKPGRGSNPLAQYGRELYDKKLASGGSDVLREFYKILLNSLYGKFIQNIANNDDDSTTINLSSQGKGIWYQAGGLWNPLLASLITGYVRAMLTDMEVNYSVLHSSTDSIMTTKRIATFSDLGKLSLKSFGNVLLIRPKFYLLWSPQSHKLESLATHGYHGVIPQLIRMLRKGGRVYKHKHMNKLRESLRTGRTPLVMEMLTKSINIPIKGRIQIPTLKWTDSNGKVHTI